jgi:hypothetical protein
MLSKEESLKWLQRRTDEYHSNENDIGGLVEDFDDMGKLGSGFVSSDKLEEVDIGNGVVKQPTYLNVNLIEAQKGKILELLREFTDYFTWSYTEMPDLSKELVVHRLPIKKGFHPYQQPARNFNSKIVGKIKEEVDRLLQEGFVHPCHYTEWVSNVVPVEKKNIRKIRV